MLCCLISVVSSSNSVGYACLVHASQKCFSNGFYRFDDFHIYKQSTKCLLLNSFLSLPLGIVYFQSLTLNAVNGQVFLRTWYIIMVGTKQCLDEKHDSALVIPLLNSTFFPSL